MKFKKPIRLFWGENYSEKPKVVLDAIKKGEENSRNSINLYPGSLYAEVIDLISKKLNIYPQQVILTHGIEGGIHLIANTFLYKNKTGGMFSPSFSAYGYYRNRSKQFIQYPCHYSREVNIDDLVKKIENCDVFFNASPNTATGNYILNLDEIEYVLRNYKGLFVIDECYLGLGKITALPLLSKYENLVIMRGITKVMGLPSLRFAFTISNQNVIKKLLYNQNDVEYDPISTYSLNIFKETFPYFNDLANTSNKFFDDFISFMRKEFPRDKFIRNLTTFHFLEMKNYKTPTYKVMNYMTEHDYQMSAKPLEDNSNIDFPEFLELVAPPKEYWQDFVKTLKQILL